jgi:hypothetical protein
LEPCTQGFRGQHRWQPDRSNADREVCTMIGCNANRERQY